MGLFPVFSKNDIVKPIIGLVVNIFFPGIGTLVCAFLSEGGTHSTTLLIGILQLLCWIGGVVLGAGLTVIGIGFIFYLLILLGWAWALIWSIIMIINAGQAPVPQQATVVSTTTIPAPAPAPAYYSMPAVAPMTAAPVYYAGAPAPGPDPVVPDPQFNNTAAPMEYNMAAQEQVPPSQI